MISRQWRGLAKPDFVDAYIEHLHTETFPAIRKLPGFRDASILRRAAPRGVEFLVITRWDSIESIRAFAGPNAEAAVVPPKVRAMMAEYDAVVQHFEIVE